MKKIELFKKIENYLKEEIINSNLSDDQKVNKIIIWTSCLCAVVAIQPIPFADIFILTSIQAIMAYFISQVRDKTNHDNKIFKERIREIFEDIGLVIAGGQVAQQGIIALYKIGLPFSGWFYDSSFSFFCDLWDRQSFGFLL